MADDPGSIRRSICIVVRVFIKRIARGYTKDPNLAPQYEDAIRDNLERFEAKGSPVVTDGHQRKYHNFCTYCVHGLPSTESLLQSPPN